MEPEAKSSSAARWVAVAGCVSLFVAGVLWLAKGLGSGERASGAPAARVAGEGGSPEGAGAGTQPATSPPSVLATAPRPPAPPSSSTTPVPVSPTPDSSTGASPPAPSGAPPSGVPPKRREGSRVAGVIVHPDGTPFVDATVWAGPADGSTRSRVYATTQADGGYVLEGLAAGRWLVQVSRADRVVEIETVEVSGATDAEVRVAKGELPPPSPAWLAATVRVVGPDGTPVPYARVAVVKPRPEGTTRPAEFSEFADFEDGRFRRLEPEPPGTIYVVAFAAASPGSPSLGYDPARFVAERPADGQVELRLAAGSTIDGRVEDEEGRPVGGVFVEGYPPEAFTSSSGSTPDLPILLAETVTDASGAFVLRGVGTGSVRVVAHGTPPFIRNGSATTVPGGARGVHLVLRKGVEARVTVLDPAGRPVVRASVNCGTTFLASSFAVTNQEGVAMLSGLDPGVDATLSVRPPSDRAELIPAVVQHWKASDVTVRLERGHRLRGRVVTPDGARGVPGTVQRLVGGVWTPVVGTQLDGTFELRGLAEGPWTLRASLFPPDSPKGPEVVITDEATDVRLILPEGPPPPAMK